MTQAYSSRLRLGLFPFTSLSGDITCNWPYSSKLETDLTWKAKQSVSCHKKVKTWSGGSELKIPSLCYRDSLMISFSFVLYSLGINQYSDYSFSAVQDNCNTEKNTMRILYRWTFKPAKMFVPRGSLFIELLFFNISLTVFLLIQN